MWQREMKKIELHCHLDGSLSFETARELAETAGIPFPEEEGFRKLFQASSKCSSLAEYLKAFQIPGKLLQREEALYLAAKDVVRQGARENVIYMEVRFAPCLHMEQGLDCRRAIESVIRGLKAGEEETGTKANAILCGMRHHPPEQNIAMGKAGLEFLGKGVCGVDIAGDEAAYPVETQKKFLSWAAGEGVPFTVHAGECGDSENIRKALELGASRIGHGIAMSKKEDLIGLCAEKGIGIELCPSSNLQTKAAPSWETYPLPEFMEKGLRVTVNTDNRTVTGTTMTRELELLEEHGLAGRVQAERMMEYALETAFLSRKEKEELRRERKKAGA